MAQTGCFLLFDVHLAFEDLAWRYFLHTNARMPKYQAMLCENPRIKLEVSATLNPATLLPFNNNPVEHDWLQIMDMVYASRLDFKYVP